MYVFILLKYFENWRSSNRLYQVKSKWKHTFGGTCINIHELNVLEILVSFGTGTSVLVRKKYAAKPKLPLH